MVLLQEEWNPPATARVSSQEQWTPPPLGGCANAEAMSRRATMAMAGSRTAGDDAMDLLEGILIWCSGWCCQYWLLFGSIRAATQATTTPTFYSCIAASYLSTNAREKHIICNRRKWCAGVDIFPTTNKYLKTWRELHTWPIFFCCGHGLNFINNYCRSQDRYRQH